MKPLAKHVSCSRCATRLSELGSCAPPRAGDVGTHRQPCTQTDPTGDGNRGAVIREQTYNTATYRELKERECRPSERQPEQLAGLGLIILTKRRRSEQSYADVVQMPKYHLADPPHKANERIDDLITAPRKNADAEDDGERKPSPRGAEKRLRRTVLDGR